MCRALVLPLRGWWKWRHIDALDIDIGAAGDRYFLIVHTSRQFKPVVEIEGDRDELIVLADMIRDAVDDRDDHAGRG